MPDLHANARARGEKNIHAGAELHDAEPIAGAHLIARLRTADDAARKDADDLTRDDRLSAVIDPDLAALVFRGGFLAIGRQKTAWRELHPGHDTRDGHAVHMHVGRREENADLLPHARRRHARFGWTADEHTSIGGRHDEVHGVGTRWRRAVRVAKEEGEKRPDRNERQCRDPAERQSDSERESDCDGDERPARRVEAQLRVLHAMAPQNAFHPVFQVQFLFFEGDFFDAFGL